MFIICRVNDYGENSRVRSDNCRLRLLHGSAVNDLLCLVCAESTTTARSLQVFALTLV